MGENGRLFSAGEDQLLFISEAQITRISSGKGIHAPSFQTLRDGDIDAFVGVDSDFAHSL